MSQKFGTNQNEWKFNWRRKVGINKPQARSGSATENQITAAWQQHDSQICVQHPIIRFRLGIEPRSTHWALELLTTEGEGRGGGCYSRLSECNQISNAKFAAAYNYEIVSLWALKLSVRTRCMCLQSGYRPATGSLPSTPVWVVTRWPDFNFSLFCTVRPGSNLTSRTAMYA